MTNFFQWEFGNVNVKIETIKNEINNDQKQKYIDKKENKMI